MANPRGLFDQTNVPEGWFDDSAQAAGWFDRDNLDVTAGGGITGTASTSQAQTVAGTGTRTVPSFTGTSTTSQAQTASATGTVTAPSFTGTAATSQAQTAAATGTVTAPAVTGTASTSQAQTVAGTGTYTPAGVSGTAATSQAQTVAGTGTRTIPAITGTGATSQAQTTAGTGDYFAGIVGTGETSQAQTTAAIGEVVNPQVGPPPQIFNLAGDRQKKRTQRELEDFYRSIGALPEIQTPTSVLSENKTQYAPIEENTAVDSTKRYIEAFERILDRIAQDTKTTIAREKLAKQQLKQIQQEIEESDIAYVASILAMSD